MLLDTLETRLMTLETLDSCLLDPVGSWIVSFV